MKSVRSPNSGESERYSFVSRCIRILTFAILAAAPLLSQSANQPTFATALPGIPPLAIAVNSEGNTYIAGTTGSANIPITVGALQNDISANGLHQHPVSTPL